MNLSYTTEAMKPHDRFPKQTAAYQPPMSPLDHLHLVGMLWFMSDKNQLSLPNPFYFVLVSICVFMAL